MPAEPNSGIPVLDSARLRLRPYRAGDSAAMFALYSDPRVMRYWSFPAWTDPAQAQAYVTRAIAAAESGELFPWAIAESASDQLIGALTLHSLHVEQRRAEVGYSLSPEFQGKGFAREALACGLAYAFETLGLRRIEADVDPRNSASCALLERLGFIREGLLRQRWLVNGEVCDSALYGLLPDDFQRQADITSPPPP